MCSQWNPLTNYKQYQNQTQVAQNGIKLSSCNLHNQWGDHQVLLLGSWHHPVQVKICRYLNKYCTKSCTRKQEYLHRSKVLLWIVQSTLQATNINHNSTGGRRSLPLKCRYSLSLTRMIHISQSLPRNIVVVADLIRTKRQNFEKKTDAGSAHTFQRSRRENQRPTTTSALSPIKILSD